jgi:hypothetical protein
MAVRFVAAFEGVDDAAAGELVRELRITVAIS